MGGDGNAGGIHTPAQIGPGAVRAQPVRDRPLEQLPEPLNVVLPPPVTTLGQGLWQLQ